MPAVPHRVFHPRRSRYCLITAAWNEPKAAAFYARVRAVKGDTDFVVAARGTFLDGYSQKELQEEFGIRAVLAIPQAGQSLAYRHAFEFALEEGYQGIVMIDSNGKDDPRALPSIIKRLEGGDDLVQACRYMPGGHEENTPRLRALAIRAIVPSILWLGCRYWYRDQTNGFKGFSRRFLEDPRIQPLRDVFVHHNLQVYLNYAAAKHGFRVVEVPASRVYPPGEVPTKLTSNAALVRLLGDYLRVSMGRLDPPKDAVDKERVDRARVGASR